MEWSKYGHTFRPSILTHKYFGLKSTPFLAFTLIFLLSWKETHPKPMKGYTYLLLIFLLQACSSTKELKFKKSMHRMEDQSLDVQTKTDSINLYGTLTLPKATNKVPLAIIIAGSGPTDRDCNNPLGNSDAYKMIAEGLMQNGIATLRYDKRMVGKSIDVIMPEEKMSFDLSVVDALSWIKLYKDDARFSSITILGHSEGSLVGILASQKSTVAKFVSLAGPAKAADDILLQQIGKQIPFAVPNVKKVFDRIKTGEIVEDVDPTLLSILRPSVQPYMASWFQYTPTEELKKLKIPVLIIQGTTDIQVETEEAEQLHAAYPSSKLKILEGSNHIFKDAPAEMGENMKTYSDPSLPLSDGFVELLAEFIKE